MRLPKLRVIGRLGVGLDNLDMAACAEREIPVFPATGANDASVAEYVLGSAFQLIRRTFTATPRILDGEWPRQDYFGEEVQGRCLGLDRLRLDRARVGEKGQRSRPRASSPMIPTSQVRIRHGAG